MLASGLRKCHTGKFVFLRDRPAYLEHQLHCGTWIKTGDDSLIGIDRPDDQDVPVNLPPVAVPRNPREVRLDREWLKGHFAKQSWEFWDKAWLRERLEGLVNSGYQNEVSAVVAKLLLRGRV